MKFILGREGGISKGKDLKAAREKKKEDAGGGYCMPMQWQDGEI